MSAVSRVAEQRFFKVDYQLEGNAFHEVFYTHDVKFIRLELAKRGAIPIRIKEKKVRWWEHEIVSFDYKVSFLRAIGFHISGGLSPYNALKTVIDDEENLSLKKQFALAKKVLEGGGSFSDALNRTGLFSETVVSLLAVGETSGTVTEAIESAIGFMEELKTIQKTMVATASVFILEFLFALSGVFALQFSLIPWIENEVMSAVSTLNDSAAAQAIMNELDLLKLLLSLLAGVGLFLGVGVAIIAWLARYSSPHLRMVASQLLGKIPGLNSIVFDTALYVQYYLISKTLAGGTSFGRAVNLCLSYSRLEPLTRMWEKVLEKLSNGHGVAYALRGEDYLSKADITKLQAHQNTSQLAHIFEVMSNERRVMANAGQKKFTRSGIALVILFSGATIGVAVWALVLQNQVIELKFSGGL